MAKLKLQDGREIEAPELGLFKTTDPDFVYVRTPEGISAIPRRTGIGPGAGFTPFTGDVSKLPQYNSGYLTDLARAMGQSGIKARSFEPGFATLGGLAPTVSQTPLDAGTAALVQAGGAGIGGFQAGGQAGISAGQALSQTPEALENRLNSLVDEKNRLQQLVQKTLSEPTSPITSKLIEPTDNLTLTSGKTPEPIPIVSPSSLTAFAQGQPDKTSTTTQEPASLQNEVQRIQNELLGFKTTKETEQGIPQIQKNQLEWQKQLQLLQAEAVDAQTRFEKEPITSGIIGKQRDEILRNNSVKALQVSALLAASQGQLSIAQDLVDKAVYQKFAPQIQDLAVRTNNLDLFLQSPNLTPSEKEKGSAQLQINTNLMAIWARQASKEKEAFDFANDAAKGGAPPALVQQIIAFSASGNKAKALILATPYLSQYGELKPGLSKAEYDNTINLAKELASKGIDITKYGVKIGAPGDTSSYADILQAAGRATAATGGAVSLDDAKKYDDIYKSDFRIESFQVVDGSYARVNTTINPDRNKINWKALAGNKPDVQVISTQWARMQKPDIARGADAGDPNDVNSLLKMAEQKFNELIADENALPAKLKDTVHSIDNLYKSAKFQKASRDRDFKAQFGDKYKIPILESSSAVTPLSNNILRVRNQEQISNESPFFPRTGKIEEWINITVQK